jgi:hypothetical protein
MSPSLIINLFKEAQFGNALQASKGQIAESTFESYFFRQAEAKNCIIEKSSTHEDRVLHIDYYVTNKRMDNLKDIFPIAEKKTDFKNLSPEQLKGLGADRLSKMTMDDLTALSDEQKAAIFDVLPPEYQELLTTEAATPTNNRVSVEVKGIKNDMPTFIPIEIETVPDMSGQAHPGWIYGKAELVAFAIGETSTSEEIKFFLMVDRAKLASKIKSFEDANKIQVVTDKKLAKTSLNNPTLMAYARMTEGQARGKVVYIPIQELIQYKRGNGVLTIKKK